MFTSTHLRIEIKVYQNKTKEIKQSTKEEIKLRSGMTKIDC